MPQGPEVYFGAQRIPLLRTLALMRRDRSFEETKRYDAEDGTFLVKMNADEELIVSFGSCRRRSMRFCANQLP